MGIYFNKSQRIDGAFGSQHNEQNQPIFTKALFVDKRHSETKPALFTLSPETIIDTDDLQLLKKQFLSGFHHESFIPIGDLVSLNRQKKIAKSSNGSLVMYTYLIVVKPTHNSSEDELFSGLITLVDALRIQKHEVPLPFTEEAQSRRAVEKERFSQEKKPDTCFKLFPATSQEASPDWVYGADVSLIEVQI